MNPQLVELVRHRPVGLDGLVAGVVGLRQQAAGMIERRQPAGSLTLVRLSLGGRMAISRLSDGVGAGRSYASFVAGFMPGFSVTQYAGRQDCLQIYLTPLGVSRIFAVTGADLARRVVDVSDVVPAFNHAFLDQLAAETHWPARFALVDALLHNLADRGREVDPATEALWRRIAASHGAVRVGELVEDSGWSHRRLLTRLREHVGVGPKAAAAIVRFERSLHQLSTTDAGLADVAYRRGYADQSHLTRDFTRYAGTSPATVRQDAVPTAWTALGRGPGMV